MSDLSIRQVDFTNAGDAAALVALLDAYSRDPMGLGAPLDQAVCQALPTRLAEHPAALAWIAWVGDEPVGLLTGLWAFSTFAARPRINIHDVAVMPGQRGRGVGRQLMEVVEQYARDTDCCALTLEVRGDNHSAKHLYQKLGFIGPTDWAPIESMVFWKKTLD